MNSPRANSGKKSFFMHIRDARASAIRPAEGRKRHGKIWRYKTSYCTSPKPVGLAVAGFAKPGYHFPACPRPMRRPSSPT